MLAMILTVAFALLVGTPQAMALKCVTVTYSYTVCNGCGSSMIGPDARYTVNETYCDYDNDGFCETLTDTTESVYCTLVSSCPHQ